MAGGVKPPISTFPSRFSPVLQHWLQTVVRNRETIPFIQLKAALESILQKS